MLISEIKTSELRRILRANKLIAGKGSFEYKAREKTVLDVTENFGCLFLRWMIEFGLPLYMQNGLEKILKERV